jgi:hypothetical protein
MQTRRVAGRSITSARTVEAAQLVAPVVVLLTTAACEPNAPPSPTPHPTAASSVASSPTSLATTTAPDPSQPPTRHTAEQFRCGALPGVRFEFPVFPQWEPKRTVERPDGCVVYLNWPIEISFETARQLQVSRVDGYDAKAVLAHAPGTPFSMGSVECFDTRRNPHGVLLSLAFDASRWTAGYRRAPGQWDYLQFYGKTTAVRLRLDGGGEQYGFSRRAFRDHVEKTFCFDK